MTSKLRKQITAAIVSPWAMAAVYAQTNYNCDVAYFEAVYKANENYVKCVENVVDPCKEFVSWPCLQWILSNVSLPVWVVTTNPYENWASICYIKFVVEVETALAEMLRCSLWG